MKLRKVTIGIQLYSIPITYTFLSYVETKSASISTNDVTVYTPIGRQVIYVIGSQTYITYTELPILVYKPYQNIEVLDDLKFNNLMLLISDQMTKQLSKISFPIYVSDGVQIQYVNQEPIVDPDARLSMLKYGISRQDQIRPLIDVIDQLFDHNPTSNVTITFYIKNSQNMFYIEQFIAKMEYAIDNERLSDIRYLYFFNKDVAYIKYQIINGDIQFELNPSFRKKIIEQFRLNYPDANSDIKIWILVLQPNVNNASILYND